LSEVWFFRSEEVGKDKVSSRCGRLGLDANYGTIKIRSACLNYRNGFFISIQKIVRSAFFAFVL